MTGGDDSAIGGDDKAGSGPVADRVRAVDVGEPEVWAPMLAEIALFAGLDRPSLRRIAAVGQVARVSAGQVIVREGTSSQGLYVLLTGKATVQSSDGREVTLGRGDYFGELGLLDAAPRTASVTADADLWVMKLPRRKFLELMETDPGIARGLLETVASRMRRSEAGVAPQREPT